MNEVLKYIHEHISEALPASEVARKFGYSKWYFCTRFKNYTGRTFVEYVRHYRIQLAALDILSGAKILDVAVSYGYDSVGGFNKAFLKEYGCSPTEYRKQAKESQLYYERRRVSMFQLSDRCALLRDEAVNQKSYMKYYGAQRNVYFALGQAEAAQAGADNTGIISAGIVRTLNSFTPVMIPGEIIVGFNFGEAAFDEFFAPKNDTAGWQVMRDNGISDTDAEQFFRLPTRDYIVWQGALLTEAEQQSNQELSALGGCCDSNHSVIGYRQVLQKGFSGLLQEVEAAKQKKAAIPCIRL